jgi:hypothetical protein
MLFGKSNVQSKFAGKSGGFWEVEAEDSVEGLLGALLTKYHSSWGGLFLTAEGKVNWKNIIISGFSQGAGYAAYLSQYLQTRAVLFSGPQDDTENAIEWTALPMNRSVVRRSLHHLHEECAPEPKSPGSYCQHDVLQRNLRRMGFGGPVLWNGTGLPASLENIMSTVPPPCLDSGYTRPYHLGIAADSCMPKSYDQLFTAMFRDMGPAE